MHMRTTRWMNAEFWMQSLTFSSDYGNSTSMTSKPRVGLSLIHPALLPHWPSSECSDPSPLPAQANPSTAHQGHSTDHL